MNSAIELKNITKSFKDFELGPISFSLPCGCIVGLVGANGAGKSTTIRLILDVLKLDGGEIAVLGKDSVKDRRDIRELVGVVPDEVSFPWCMNALQVGKMMKKTYRSWDEKAFAHYLARFELPPKKAFKNYSKGMKMKLGIAVALSHDAKILILDEATGGLDPVVRDEVIELFGEFTRNEERAVLLSSHIVSDIEKICDYVAFLHEGKLLLFEEKDLLLARYGCWHGSAEEAALLPEGAVVGKRETPYGVDAVLLRGELKEDLPLSPINMEELFLTVVKEAKK